MNYYILPKNSIQLHINPTFIETYVNPYIGHSLKHFLQNSEYHLKEIELTTFTELQNIINTYEFIFTNVPNYPLSVSKVKPDGNVFYELIEIFYTCNLEELFLNKNKINTLHLSPNYNSSIFFINVVREDKSDDIMYGNLQTFDQSLILENKKIDFLFFEGEKENYKNNCMYSHYLILGLQYIIKYQNISGITIFKIDNIFYKVIIDVMYILSNLFEKVYIFKPTVSNITQGERFLVCKYFNPSSVISLVEIERKLNEILSLKLQINTLLNNVIPYHFTNKIEESNIVIGQQQLESLSLIINLIKNRNKEDKIETLKRNHIQKCIQWCEKYKIPHNKFMDKTNIFLNNKNIKEISEGEEDDMGDLID